MNLTILMKTPFYVVIALTQRTPECCTFAHRQLFKIILGPQVTEIQVTYTVQQRCLCWHFHTLSFDGTFIQGQ